MKPGPVVRQSRKQCLVARIAMQRSQLERELSAFRASSRAFEVARVVGAILRRNAKLFGGIAAVTGFLLIRGRIFPKALRTVQLVSFALRTWVLARLGWEVLRRWRGGERLMVFGGTDGSNR